MSSFLSFDLPPSFYLDTYITFFCQLIYCSCSKLFFFVHIDFISIPIRQISIKKDSALCTTLVYRLIIPLYQNTLYYQPSIFTFCSLYSGFLFLLIVVLVQLLLAFFHHQQPSPNRFTYMHPFMHICES